MSWQSYIDNLLATKSVIACGIFSLNDGTPWAISPNFNLSQDQVKQLVHAINDNSKIAQNGFVIGADKYFYVKNDPNISLLLKKGPSGVIAYKSIQVVIIAIHNNDVKSEVAATNIGKTVDHLARHGF